MTGFSLVTWAVSGAVVTLRDSQGTPIPSGTLKLTEEGARGSGFFLISDNDGDAKIGLVDLDGKAIPDGRYIVQIEDQNKNVVRGGVVWVVRKNRVYEVDADGNEVALSTGSGSSGLGTLAVIGGGALITAAVVGGGGSSGGNNSEDGDTNPDEGNDPPPEETGPTILSGTINCNVDSDPSDLADDIGTVGGTSEFSVDGNLLVVTMPIGGSDIILNGSAIGNNFSVSGFSILAGAAGVGILFTGIFDVTGGPASGQLHVGNNGALPDEPNAEHPGVIYSCSGNLDLEAA